MPTGYVDRIKGKIAQGPVFVGGQPLTPKDQATAVGWGSIFNSSSTMGADNSIASTRPAGVDIWSPPALTSGSIFRLPKPIVGGDKVLLLSTVNGSTIMFVTLSTDGSVVLLGVGSSGSTTAFGTGGSTVTNTIKSTIGCQMTMIGLSSSQWLFTGVIPTTIGHLTFSTTT